MNGIYGLYADIRVLEQEELFRHFFYQLSQKRQQKIDALPLVHAKCQSLGAWTLLDRLLADHMGLRERELEIAIGAHRKPYVVGCRDIWFNLSHSGDYVLAVLAPVEVGCDIQREEETGREEKLAARFFSEEEQEALASGESFYRIWARKESWIKCDGSGMTQDLRSFSVTGDRACGRQFAGLRLDGYELAVCYEGTQEYSVRLEEIDLQKLGGD